MYSSVVSLGKKFERSTVDVFKGASTQGYICDPPFS